MQNLNNKLDILNNENYEDKNKEIDELTYITDELKNDIIKNENEYTNLTSKNEELNNKLEKLKKDKDEKIKKNQNKLE